VADIPLEIDLKLGSSSQKAQIEPYPFNSFESSSDFQRKTKSPAWFATGRASCNNSADRLGGVHGTGVLTRRQEKGSYFGAPFLQFAAEQYLASFALGPPVFPQVFTGQLTVVGLLFIDFP
jgi:hypothetical protein